MARYLVPLGIFLVLVAFLLVPVERQQREEQRDRVELAVKSGDQDADGVERVEPRGQPRLAPGHEVVSTREPIQRCAADNENISFRQ